MSDTTVRYDISIYTRIDSKKFPPEISLEMVWTSPLDSVWRETVYLPLDRGEVYAAYRTGLEPSVPGVWNLTVSAPAAFAIKGFRGLGLVTEKVWDTEN